MKKSFTIILLLLAMGYQNPNIFCAPQPPQEDFCPQMTGRVIFQGQPGYDEARLVSNYYKSKNQFPKAIVYSRKTQDVQNAVKWARCHNLPIRIRSGGHNHEGYSTGNGVLIIDVSEMKQLQIDKANNTITVQPGINNLELYNKLFKEGLTHVGGTCSEVGLSGLVLSGGMGPLLRKVGLTCDSLLSIEIVDAKGEVINATKDNEYSDLFWASCGGGGGNFGIVTSMVLKAYPAESVTWFNIGWDWDQPVDKVITAWQDFFARPNRKWFSHLDVWSKAFPSDRLKKHPVKVLGFYYGTPEEAKRELAPLLAIGTPQGQTIKAVDWAEAIKLIEESTAVFITEKPEYKSTGAFAMENLPVEAVQTIHKTLSDTTSPLFNVLLFSMGGATQDIAPTETAYYYRDAKFFINYSIQWLKESESTKQIDEVETLRQQLLPYTVGDYVGNPDAAIKDYLAAYYGKNAERLQAIKKKYDPENVFSFQQSVEPKEQ